MFDVTNYKLVLGVCIVNVVIFIKKKIKKIVLVQFLWIGKETHDENFEHVEKITPCFFSSKAI